jgi:uncharacterized protein (DUF1810 family)
MKEPDPFLLSRFVEAQEDIYLDALAEIRNGEKESHWMWFIFPQVAGLGSSSTAERFAIGRTEEAKAYLDHPVLGVRLMACCAALMKVEGKSASEVFGYPDDMKLRSSMTLFAAVAADPSPFNAVLEKYFAGEPDRRTLEILAR